MSNDAQWESLQKLWQTQPLTDDRLVVRVEAERARARWLVWLDLVATLVFVGAAAVMVIFFQSPAMSAWAVTTVVFTAVAVAFGVWNRRNERNQSARSTRDYLAELERITTRKRRLLTFVPLLAAVEVAVGVLLFVRYWPSRWRIAVLCYAAVSAAVFIWWRRTGRRLRGETEQIGQWRQSLDE